MIGNDDFASPIDRNTQRKILLHLRAIYPERTQLVQTLEMDREEMVRNLTYLQEHGLVDGGVRWSAHGYSLTYQSLTAKGVDFLEDDGGLSAILNTVTIRMHADTIRDLIAVRIDATDLPPERKSAIKQHLAALSEAGLRAATTDLVQAGLRHLEDVPGWLRTLGAL